MTCHTISEDKNGNDLQQIFHIHQEAGTVLLRQPHVTVEPQQWHARDNLTIGTR